MSETIPPQRFHEADWRVVRTTRPRTSVPSRSRRASRWWTRSGGWPTPRTIPRRRNLRSDGVTVRVGTHSAGLSERDVDLARQISAAAHELGVPVDLTGMQIVQVAIDALVIPDVLPFWRAVLGYRQVGGEDVVDPHLQGPPFWFQQMDAPRPQRNRIHIDIYVPHDQAEARVAAAIAAGGHLVSDENAPGWWTLADAEGNEVDVASWPDRD